MLGKQQSSATIDKEANCEFSQPRSQTSHSNWVPILKQNSEEDNDDGSSDQAQQTPNFLNLKTKEQEEGQASAKKANQSNGQAVDGSTGTLAEGAEDRTSEESSIKAKMNS